MFVSKCGEVSSLLWLRNIANFIDITNKNETVPAQVADIDFVEEGSVIQDGLEDEATIGRGGITKKQFKLSGWDNTRVLTAEELKQDNNRIGNIPIFWTPTIKALWAPISFPNMSGNEENDLLPVHKLRLSASALRLKQCQRVGKSKGEVPLGLALVVDNVLIEIGEQVKSGAL